VQEYIHEVIDGDDDDGDDGVDYGGGGGNSGGNGGGGNGGGSLTFLKPGLDLLAPFRTCMVHDVFCAFHLASNCAFWLLL